MTRLPKWRDPHSHTKPATPNEANTHPSAAAGGCRVLHRLWPHAVRNSAHRCWLLQGLRERDARGGGGHRRSACPAVRQIDRLERRERERPATVSLAVLAKAEQRGWKQIVAKPVPSSWCLQVEGSEGVGEREREGGLLRWGQGYYGTGNLMDCSDCVTTRSARRRISHRTVH